MPNKNYRKGYRKERQIVNEARERGCIAFRSAGSHSPIDVCIINKKYKTIQFLQCKSGKFYTESQMVGKDKRNVIYVEEL